MSSQWTTAVLEVDVAEEEVGRGIWSHLDVEPDSLGQKLVSAWTQASPHFSPRVLLYTHPYSFLGFLFNIHFPLLCLIALYTIEFRAIYVEMFHGR